MKEYLLKPITETAEQAIEAKGQKGKIAKQILLGIDSHVNSYQVRLPSSKPNRPKVSKVHGLRALER